MTLRNVVNDILTVLKARYDDSKLTFNSVLYHTLIYANRLKSQHIEKRDTGLFTHTYTEVPVIFNAATNRKYIELPHYIYSFDRDGGVKYITYHHDIDVCRPGFTSTNFTRTTHSSSPVLYWTPEERPCPANPYFIMEFDKTLLLGIEDIDVKLVECGLLSTFDINDYFIELRKIDDLFDFPDELLSILQRQVLDVGRFTMMMPREINDNIQPGDIPTQKIVPVAQATGYNEQNQQQ